MNDRFQKEADQLLASLCWRQSDQARVLSALEEEKPKMKKKVTASFMLAALLILLAAAALAWGLTYSPRAVATLNARQALMEARGLSKEMVQMYSREETREQDGQTVTEYSVISDSQFVHKEAMGVYTVTQDGKGGYTVTWSHDDVDPDLWQDGDLSAPVWGPPQLQGCLDRYQIYRQWRAEQEATGLFSMPYEVQAERYARLQAQLEPLVLLEGPIDLEQEAAKIARMKARDAALPKPDETPPQPEESPAPTPQPGDMNAEKATLLARQALAAEYGLTEQELDEYLTEVRYQYDDAEGSCDVTFYGTESMGSVVLDPRTGEIRQVVLDSGLSGNG